MLHHAKAGSRLTYSARLFCWLACIRAGHPCRPLQAAPSLAASPTRFNARMLTASSRRSRCSSCSVLWTTERPRQLQEATARLYLHRARSAEQARRQGADQVDRDQDLRGAGDLRRAGAAADRERTTSRSTPRTRPRKKRRFRRLSTSARTNRRRIAAKREEKEEKEREDDRKFVQAKWPTPTISRWSAREAVGGRRGLGDRRRAASGIRAAVMKEAKFLPKFRGRVWIDQERLATGEDGYARPSTRFPVGWVLARYSQGLALRARTDPGQ